MLKGSRFAEHPLAGLIPYLGRYRAKLLLGTGMVLATNAVAVVTPWVLGRAIDDLRLEVTRDKLLIYATVLVGLSALEGVFRFLMRSVLIPWRPPAPQKKASVPDRVQLCGADQSTRPRRRPDPPSPRLWRAGPTAQDQGGFLRVLDRSGSSVRGSGAVSNRSCGLVRPTPKIG